MVARIFISPVDNFDTFSYGLLMLFLFPDVDGTALTFFEISIQRS